MAHGTIKFRLISNLTIKVKNLHPATFYEKVVHI